MTCFIEGGKLCQNQFEKWAHVDDCLLDLVASDLADEEASDCQGNK